MLFVQLESRYTIYDSNEKQGQFIVEASISYTYGELIAPKVDYELTKMLKFEIQVEQTTQLLVSDVVKLRSGPQLYAFDFGSLEPRLEPYKVILNAALGSQARDQNYTIATELYHLPAKNSGSTVKVDKLHGGMLVANNVTDYEFEPLLPFGFYTSCSGYLNYSSENVTTYKDLGFNAINPVCAFTDGNLGYLFDWLDVANLWYQYDMRGSYTNLSSVAEQIPLIKDRSSFLSWYTADEPDGWQYALNSTRLAHDLLKKEDPYHPTGLVLNCDNYHFEHYSAGADYLMEDAYPMGINPIHSRPWNTTCNTTYGDCGCDNCIGELEDVSNRLDSYAEYQQWLGRWQKPLWAVLQAFHGEYWERNPTSDETWAMMLLSFNHGAKAMMSWLFPTSRRLTEAHAAFAKVATQHSVSIMLLNAEPVPVNDKHNILDISYWSNGDLVMVGIVHLDNVDRYLQVDVELPFAAVEIESQPWGTVSWTLIETVRGCTLRSTHGLGGFATNIVILRTRTGR